MKKISYTVVIGILITCSFLSCEDSPQPRYRNLSVEESYQISRDVERETGMYCGACTNKTHRYDVDYCTKYVGERARYGVCENCGCSRYNHWGDVGL